MTGNRCIIAFLRQARLSGFGVESISSDKAYFASNGRFHVVPRTARDFDLRPLQARTTQYSTLPTVRRIAHFVHTLLYIIQVLKSSSFKFLSEKIAAELPDTLEVVSLSIQ